MASIISVKSGWRGTVRIKGFPQQSKTFTKKSDCVAWASKLETDHRENMPVEGSNITVKHMIEVYEQLRQASPRPILHGSNSDFMIRHLLAEFGDKTPNSLIANDYVNYVTKRLAKNKEGKGRNALGMELKMLDTIFKKTAKRLSLKLNEQLPNAIDILADSNVIKTSSKNRERRISNEEIELFLQFPEIDPVTFQPINNGLPEKMHGVFKIALILGLRLGEILELKWADYDPVGKMIWCRNRKHPRDKRGNDSLLPLILGSWEVIEAQPRIENEPRIFPNMRVENVSDAFHRVCVRYKILDLRFHDLRHESISRLFEKGLPIARVAQISGHKSWAHLKRYTNLRPQDLHDMVHEY